MATLKPFRMALPAENHAAGICSLPYDIINTREAVELAKNNPDSFVRVTRSEVDFPEQPKPYPDEVYDHAKEILDGLFSDGRFIRTDSPCMMIYRLKMGSHTQTGIVGLSSCKEFRTGVIKNHELTRPDKIEERVRHIKAVKAHTGPVFLMYRAADAIDELVNTEIQKAPYFDFTSDDGISHTAWLITEDSVMETIQNFFGEIPSLYIADGHHLTAAANIVAKEETAKNPNHTGDEDYNFFLTVCFPHDQVQVLSYNRVLRDLNGSTPQQVLQMMRELATVEPLEYEELPSRKGIITFYLDKKWYKLRWKPSIAQSADPLAALDVSILQNRLLSPVLFIENPRTDKRIRFAGVNRGIKELEKLVDSGENAIAFVVYPTSIHDLMSIADRGSLMPPKSTWFAPKVRDGIAVHLI